ncbi:MAG: MEKHLA domain-containing protein [Sphingobium sp.]|nr:MEKHLA domain-containing protein [Sphingobium sp.]
MAAPPLPERFATAEMRVRLALIVSSYKRLTKRALIETSGDVAEALWHAPLAIAAHGSETDPLFFFGNRIALDCFETDVQDFCAMPSRLSAEPVLREARQAVLDRVRRHGFIADYSAVRISATGRRFRIEHATVWNLIDEQGAIHGQAAAFKHWTDLP